MAQSRSIVSYLLSLLLFVALLGTALTISLSLTAKDSQRIKQWLDSSPLYDLVLQRSNDQATKAYSSNNGSVTISTSDIKPAIKNAIPKQFVSNSSHQIIDGTYPWLNGQQAKPTFKIDTNPVKQSFAQAVSNQVQSRLSSLPPCTFSQLLTLRSQTSIDATSLNCLPPTINPSGEGTTVANNILQNSNFLPSPFTADSSLLSTSDASPKPFYRQFSKVPRAYRTLNKLPWIL